MLTPIADDLWSVDFWHKVGPGFHLPARMVVIRLGSGELLLHSPAPMDDTLAAEFAALGPVRHLVAPNLYHHSFLLAAAQRYGQARVYAPVGIEHKRQDVGGYEALGASTPTAWGDDLELVPVMGAGKMSEVVFFHRRSRTVIACDLVFNLPAARGFWAPVILRLAGTHRGLAQSRLWHFFVDDSQAAAASVERILAWDVERIVMSHGDIIAGTDCRERLARALARMRPR